MRRPSLKSFLSFTLFLFAVIGSLAVFLFSLMVLLGSSPRALGLKSVYFLKLDPIHIPQARIGGPVSNSSDTVSGSMGIFDYYSFGAGGICGSSYVSGQSGPKFYACNAPSTPYSFDFVQLLVNSVSEGVTVEVPQDITEYQSTLNPASKAIWAFYFLSVLFSGLTFCSGLGSLYFREALYGAFIGSAVSSIFILIASCVSTGVYMTYRQKFLNVQAFFGMSPTVGNAAYALTWLAAVISIGATLSWAIVLSKKSLFRYS
ncbi:hypothetical protein TRVA0_010S01992 [Trichomonascus vanleenenianus]|uniref:SUR7/PalI family protein n=1 Tax=Trichomonascus vanleenenianus TaxID=2268995 RepID=UPI003ECA1452